MKSWGVVSPVPVGKTPLNAPKSGLPTKSVTPEPVEDGLRTTIAYLSEGSSVCGSAL